MRERIIHLEGNRDLSQETFGIVAQNADDGGSAEEGVFCRDIIHHAGNEIWGIFDGSGAKLQGEAVVLFDDSNSEGNDDPKEKKLAAVVEAAAEGANAVEHALDKGETVLSIGGNHVRGYDVIGAMRHCHKNGIELGLIWVDAHPDLNTPETTPSGNLHGMVSAVLTGKGPKDLLDLLEGASFIKPENIIYVGLNDVDDQEGQDHTERSYLEELKAKGVGVKAFEIDDVKNPKDQDKIPQPILDAVTDLGHRLEEKGGKLWVELDVDVFRKEDMPAAVMDNDNGMRVEQGYDLFKHIGKITHPLGMGVSELSQNKDPDHVGAKIVAHCIAHTMGISEPLYHEVAKNDPETVNIYAIDETREIIDLGNRRIYKKPGCEYVRRKHGYYTWYVTKDEEVIEIKDGRNNIKNFSLGCKVQVNPMAVNQFGSRIGTIVKMHMPGTNGRDDIILDVEFEGGGAFSYRISEVNPVEEQG